MKKKIVWVIMIFPCLTFAVSHAKSNMTAELYISNEVINKMLDTKNHFDHSYKPKDSIQSIFENKKSSAEIHFAPLDLNQEVIEDVSMQWLPLYDFSKDGDIQDYENYYKIPHACPFRLLKIRFPFF